ncbi:MAG: NUDIX hydrolase [Ignavibacteriaceae bacterium]|nr:NUDIX hydrolase [Ignavibacteriaceae bacterium]
MALSRWNKINSEKITGNPYWSYLLDKFEIPGINYQGEYHYVHTEGSTLLIPITKDGKLILVKQFRYLNQDFSWEFPCGGVIKGLDLKENALKELSEETGYSATIIEYAGKFNPFSGVTDEMCYVFLAKELFPKVSESDIYEQTETAEFTIEEFEKMIEANEIWDGMSLAAWSLVKEKVLKFLV